MQPEVSIWRYVYTAERVHLSFWLHWSHLWEKNSGNYSTNIAYFLKKMCGEESENVK